VEKNLMVHLLLDWQKDEYLSFSLEAVPRLVISHLLQPVIRLCWGLQLLLLLFLFFFLKIINIASLSIRFWVSVSNQNLLMASSSSFISFTALAPDLQQSALLRLLCMTVHSWRTVKPLWYKCLIQWWQNVSKAMMWHLYKIPAIRGCPRRFY